MSYKLICELLFKRKPTRLTINDASRISGYPIPTIQKVIALTTNKLNSIYNKYQLLKKYNLQTMNDNITYSASKHHVTINTSMGGAFHRGDANYSGDIMIVKTSASITNNKTIMKPYSTLIISDAMGNIKVSKKLI